MQGASEPLYMEFIDFVAAGTTPEDVINFRPSAQAQERLSELLERNREGTLTEDESAELDKAMTLEHIMRIAKAKARLILANRT
jgi:hypothetical protein